MMQTDPCVLTWLKWRAGTPLFDFCFFVKGKPAWGVHRPWRKISLRVCKGISQFLLNSIWTLPVVFKSLLAYWCHLASGIRDDIGSGNGLLHDGTKPLPEPMLTYRNSSPVTFFWGHLHKRYISYEIIQLASKLLTLIKFKYPRGNELKHNAIIWTIIDFFSIRASPTYVGDIDFKIRIFAEKIIWKFLLPNHDVDHFVPASICWDRFFSQSAILELNRSLKLTSIRSFQLGCTSGDFKCGRGNCIPDFYKCDGNDDCGDFSDEDPSLCSRSHLSWIFWKKNKLNNILKFKNEIKSNRRFW